MAMPADDHYCFLDVDPGRRLERPGGGGGGREVIGRRRRLLIWMLLCMAPKQITFE